MQTKYVHTGGRTTMPHGKIMRFLMDRRLDDDVLAHDQVLLAIRKRIQVRAPCSPCSDVYLIWCSFVPLSPL